MKDLKERVEIMQGALDGKKIRHRNFGAPKWVMSGNPTKLNFDWGYKDYEIVPEPLEMWGNWYNQPDGTRRISDVYYSRDEAVEACGGEGVTIKLVEADD